jgi:hypothetical protein
VFAPTSVFPGLRVLCAGGKFHFLLIRFDTFIDVARTLLLPLLDWLERSEVRDGMALPFLVWLQYQETLRAIGFVNGRTMRILYGLRQKYRALRNADDPFRQNNPLPIIPLRFLLHYSVSHIDAFVQCERRASMSSFDSLPQLASNRSDAWLLATEVLAHARFLEHRIVNADDDPSRLHLEPSHSWCRFIRARPQRNSTDLSTPVCAGYLPAFAQPFSASQTLALLIVECFGRDWRVYVRFAFHHTQPRLSFSHLTFSHL